MNCIDYRSITVIFSSRKKHGIVCSMKKQSEFFWGVYGGISFKNDQSSHYLHVVCVESRG